MPPSDTEGELARQYLRSTEQLKACTYRLLELRQPFIGGSTSLSIAHKSMHRFTDPLQSTVSARYSQSAPTSADMVENAQLFSYIVLTGSQLHHLLRTAKIPDVCSSTSRFCPGLPVLKFDFTTQYATLETP